MLILHELFQELFGNYRAVTQTSQDPGNSHSSVLTKSTITTSLMDLRSLSLTTRNIFADVIVFESNIHGHGVLLRGISRQEKSSYQLMSQELLMLTIQRFPSWEKMIAAIIW